MLINFGRKKEFDPSHSPYASLTAGAYAVDGEKISWVKCREQFAVKFSHSVDGIYFVHKKGQGESVAAFILQAEKVLGIHYKERSIFSKTNKDSVIWVSVSCFWKECELRRSLFTILLRAGMDYSIEKNNFSKTLFSNLYVRQTEVAIKRFFFGFVDFRIQMVTTHYAGDHRMAPSQISRKGWVNTFKDAGFKDVKKILVKPAKKNPEDNFLAVGTLWA
jgi:hypothetical protein